MSDDNNPVKISGGTIHVDTGDERVQQAAVPDLLNHILALGNQRGGGPSV